MLYYTHTKQSMWWNEKGASKHTYELWDICVI